MKEDFVTYDIAVKLKEKGFPMPTNIVYAAYNQDGKLCPMKIVGETINKKPIAPTIGQVLKWLREEKNIYINISYSRMDKWFYKIYNLKNTGDFMLAADFDIESYEQCAFEGVEYVTDYLI